MNARNVKILAAVVVIFVAVLLILDQGRSPNAVNTRLLPDLRSHINDVTALIIRSGSETVTVAQAGDIWSVRERSNYAADIGKLRQLLLALAEARVVERKTSNPEKYHLIGVNDPADDDSESVEFTIKGDGVEQVLILGKSTLGDYRYARASGEAQSVLIDKNPDVPGDAGGWLAQAILDISADRVQRVTIAHVDGEEIRIEKESQETGDFQVINIPDGRELSYPSVANGISGALDELSLSDVRKAPANKMTPDVLTTFRTFDGLIVEAAIIQDGESSWVSIMVSNGAADGDPETDGEAERINQRVSGWQYAIPDYKANLLKRHFEDILKAPDQE